MTVSARRHRPSKRTCDGRMLSAPPPFFLVQANPAVAPVIRGGCTRPHIACGQTPGGMERYKKSTFVRPVVTSSLVRAL